MDGEFTAVERSHWAFQPIGNWLARSESGRVSHPIDAFKVN